MGSLLWNSLWLIAADPHRGGSISLRPLICWRRNYPHGGGTRPVNRAQNEFIWIRTYEGAADLEAKTQAFRKAVEAAGITLGTNVAKMQVREVEMA